MIKLVSAPIRRVVRFPLFQLAVVIGIILWLQNAADGSMFGRLFDGLDKLVDSTVQLFSTVFTIKSFTKAWLISGFMIAYVYLAGLLILFLLRLMIRFAVDLVGRSNFTRSSKASANICGSGPHGLVAPSCLAKRTLGKRRWSRRRRLLIGPSPLKRSDLSRPSHRIEKAIRRLVELGLKAKR
jgi:hypothetical protein